MATSQPQFQIPPSAQVLQMAFGHCVAACIYQAARLGVADLLRDGPQSAADLAGATKTNEDALYRML